MPIKLLIPALSAIVSRPKTLTEPSVGSKSEAIDLMSVVLPWPLRSDQAKDFTLFDGDVDTIQRPHESARSRTQQALKPPRRGRMENFCQITNGNGWLFVERLSQQ